MKRFLCIVLILVMMAVFASVDVIQRNRPPVPSDPLEGEALWYSLPPELLSNVIAEKQEQIADIEDDISRIQEIQRELWEKVEK